MNFKKVLLFVGYFLFSFFTYSKSQSEAAYSKEKENKHTQYEELNHKIILNKFRAGNHDTSGENKYFFKAYLKGLIDSPEEKKLNDEKKKNIKTEISQNWKLKLPSLSSWKKEDKNPYELEIAGDTIRSLVAKMMTKFKRTEKEIAIRMHFELWQEKKKYFVLNDDKKIGAIDYFIIPFLSFEKIQKDNKDLFIYDDTGLAVKLHIQYNKDEEKKPSKEKKQ